MTYRELEYRRILQGTAGRRTTAGWVGIAVVLLLGGSLMALMMVDSGRRLAPDGGSALPSVAAPKGGMLVSYGFRRTALSRTMTVAVPTGRSAGPYLVRLEADLSDPRTGKQFPARQIVVGGSEVSPGMLALAVSADPWSPERVGAGRFHGRIVISGAGAGTSVPLVLDTADRDGTVAWIAFLVAAAGAACGLLIKWITERLTVQAMSYRRLAALRRDVGGGADGRCLPGPARLRMNELQEVISRQEFGRAEQLFAELEPEREALASIASHFSMVYDLLTAQALAIEARSQSVSRAVLARADAILDDCHRRLRLAQNAPWPDEDGQTAKELDTIRQHLVLSGQVLASFLSSPNEQTLRTAMDLLQRGDFDEAAAEYDRFVQSGAKEVGEAAEPLRGRVRRSVRIGRGDKILIRPWHRLARPIVGAASVLVVALVGLKLQYLDNQTFQGDLAAWVWLGLWGFMVELSGSAVVDVAAQLAPGRAGRVPPPAA